MSSLFLELVKYIDLPTDINILESPPTNQLPANKPCRNIPLQTYKLTSSRNTAQLSNQPYSNDHPYVAPITRASWLTSLPTNDSSTDTAIDTDPRKVILLELSILNGSGLESYCPGDSIGIYTPNPIHLVKEIINKLSIYHNTIDNIHIDEYTEVRSVCLPAGICKAHEQCLSLLEIISYRYVWYLPFVYICAMLTGICYALLIHNKSWLHTPIYTGLFVCKLVLIYYFTYTYSYRVDLVGPPKKLALIPLIEYCQDSTDKIALQWLLSKGLCIYYAFVYVPIAL